jgi:hypothetical protein
MPPKHSKKGRVKVLATRFDEGRADRNGPLFSARHAASGGGAWCHGTITYVCALRSRPIQTYKIKHDDGGPPLESTEAHVEPLADTDSEDEADNSESSDDGPVEDVVDGQRGPGDEGCDGASTDSESERDEDPNGVDEATVTATAIGGLVEVAGVTWKRVAPSAVLPTRAREEPEMLLRNITVDANTTELDVHDALLPVSMEFLHGVVAFRAAEANDKRTCAVDHLRAFLVCLHGGAQFKEGTELWAETACGVMPAPRFGRRLNKGRFERTLRCMARGPGGCEDPEDPWFPVR